MSGIIPRGYVSPQVRSLPGPPQSAQSPHGRERGHRRRTGSVHQRRATDASKSAAFQSRRRPKDGGHCLDAFAITDGRRGREVAQVVETDGSPEPGPLHQRGPRGSAAVYGGQIGSRGQVVDLAGGREGCCRWRPTRPCSPSPSGRYGPPSIWWRITPPFETAVLDATGIAPLKVTYPKVMDILTLSRLADSLGSPLCGHGEPIPGTPSRTSPANTSPPAAHRAGPRGRAAAAETAHQGRPKGSIHATQLFVVVMVPAATARSREGTSPRLSR